MRYSREAALLKEIQNLLKERGAMSLKEIALHFQMEPSAVEGMLETLERKGRVSRLDTQCAACKGCAMVQREEALIFKKPD